METRTNLIKELSLRVYQKIGEEQLKVLLMDGKPLMKHDELIQYINDNLNEYLTAEDQKQLFIDNLYNISDEKIKCLLMNLAIEMAAGYVQNAIVKALSIEDFFGDNPFSVQSNPQLFMIHKYFDEELEVKLN